MVFGMRAQGLSLGLGLHKVQGVEQGKENFRSEVSG